MTNIPTIINFTLDKSGSMGVVQSGTIQGFNTFLNEQKALPGDARMSLTLFDTEFEARHVAMALSEVPDLTKGTYIPGGMTALLDAVGTTIKGTEGWLAKHPGDWHVVNVILTDGQENASHQWHINEPRVDGDAFDLAGLIEWKQKEGWEFVFLGSGGSAWLERTFGHIVGMDHVHSLAHTDSAHTHAYASVSRSVGAYRGGKGWDTSSVGSDAPLSSKSKSKS